MEVRGVISPLVWVITVVTLLVTLLTTAHEPPSTGALNRCKGTPKPETLIAKPGFRVLGFRGLGVSGFRGLGVRVPRSKSKATRNAAFPGIWRMLLRRWSDG